MLPTTDVPRDGVIMIIFYEYIFVHAFLGLKKHSPLPFSKLL